MIKTTTDQAQASPTKRFFVSMLTRDINLADAILDLLDNCLDGARRLADGGNVDYAQHFVKTQLVADHFSIEDNCGGIPLKVAKTTPLKQGARCWCGLAIGNTFFRGVDHLGLMATLPHLSVILLCWAV
jgi:hypothetical protein